MKIVIVLALIGIIGALASAGTMMLRRPSDPATNDDRAEQPADKRMARALAWRVGLSVALFLFILLAWALGWIQPGGLPVSSR
jgi:archaellum biogenesis protein FlaJ (TadC family)